MAEVMLQKRKTVSLRRLKEFAIRRLPKDHVLKQVLLVEPDDVDAEEFVAKIPMWLRLLDG